jgi:hypothetical protein
MRWTKSKKRIIVWKRKSLESKSKSIQIRPVIYTTIKEKGEMRKEEVYLLFPSKYKNLVDKILSDLQKEGEIIVTENMVKCVKKMGRLEL